MSFVSAKMTTDKKLDLILQRLDSIEENIQKINGRIVEINEKLDRVSDRIDTLETNFEKNCQEFELLQKTKADVDTMDAIKDKLAFLEKFYQNYEKNKIMQECYDKRLNVLIHGVKEDGENVWEKRKQQSKN